MSNSQPKGLVLFDEYKFDPVFLAQCPGDLNVFWRGIHIITEFDMCMREDNFSEETEKQLNSICDNGLGGWRLPIGRDMYWFRHSDYREVIRWLTNTVTFMAFIRPKIMFTFCGPREIADKLRVSHPISKATKEAMAKKYQEVYGILPEEEHKS